MKVRFFVIPALWALLLGLLFIPVVQPSYDRLISYGMNWMHFPAFAFFATSGFILLNDRYPSAVLLSAILSLLILCGVELLQPLCGRSAEWGDVALGSMGVMFAMCLLFARVTRRVSWLAIALVILFSSLAPVGLILLDRRNAAKQMPVLASFESALELGRWSSRGCSIQRSDEQSSVGVKSLRIFVDGTESYPGVFMMDFRRNWLMYNELQMDVYCPGQVSKVVWIRLDDYPNAPFKDRVQDRFKLNPGWNTIGLNGAQLKLTPGKRLLDRSRILQVGIFFDQAEPGDILFVDNLRLGS